MALLAPAQHLGSPRSAAELEQAIESLLLQDEPNLSELGNRQIELGIQLTGDGRFLKGRQAFEAGIQNLGAVLEPGDGNLRFAHFHFGILLHYLGTQGHNIEILRESLGAFEYCYRDLDDANVQLRELAFNARLQHGWLLCTDFSPLLAEAELDQLLFDLVESGQGNERIAYSARRFLAMCFTRRLDYHAAAKLLEEAYEGFVIGEGVDGPNSAQTGIELAAVYVELGRHERAEELYDASFAPYAQYFERDPNRLTFVRYHMALNLFGLGRLSDSRQLFERTLRDFEGVRQKNDPMVLETKVEFAKVLVAQGHAATGEAILEECLQLGLESLGESRTVQLARLALADLREARGELEQSERLRRQAIDSIAKRVDAGSIPALEARMDLATELCSRDEADALQEAVQLAESALSQAVRFHGADSIVANNAGQCLSRVRLAQGRLTEALELADTCMAALNKHPETSADSRRALGLHRAYILALMGERKLVRTAVLEVGALLEKRMRRAQVSRGWFPLKWDAQHVAASVDGLLSLTMSEEGQDVELNRLLLLLIELNRGDPMPLGSHQVAGGEPESSSAKNANELHAELRSELRRRSEQLGIAIANRVSPADLAEIRMARDRVEERLLEFGPRRDLPGMDEVHGALKPGEYAVSMRRYRKWEFSKAPSRIRADWAWVAFVLLPSGDVARVELGGDAAVSSAIADLRQLVEDELGWSLTPDEQSRRAEVICERLGTLLWKPVLEAVGSPTKVHMSLDGPLELVPLEEVVASIGDLAPPTTVWPSLFKLAEWNSRGIAPDQGLESKCRLVSIAPNQRDPVRSENEGLEPASRKHGTGPQELDSAGGNRNSERVTLLEAWREVQVIDSLFRRQFPACNTLIVESQESLANLLDASESAHFLHIATHGVFESELTGELEERVALDPLIDVYRSSWSDQFSTVLSPLSYSGLELGPQPNELVRAEVLATLNLKACDLVVLSACDSSLGVVAAGRGLASLQSAFLIAGADAVLGARWRVGDRSARAFMEHFYSYLWIEGLDAQESLRRAKRAMRAEKNGDGSSRWEWRDLAAWNLVGSPN